MIHENDLQLKYFEYNGVLYLTFFCQQVCLLPRGVDLSWGHLDSNEKRHQTTKQPVSRVQIMPFKSDFNEMLFVLEVGELLCKIIEITTLGIFKESSIHKKYLKNV